MLQYLPDVAQTVKGLGIITDTQKPFVRFLVKNWPLALFAGYALFARGRERHKKGELNTFNMLGDMGLILSPLVGLALLNQMAQQDCQLQAATAALTPPATTVQGLSYAPPLGPPAGPPPLA